MMSDDCPELQVSPLNATVPAFNPTPEAGTSSSRHSLSDDEIDEENHWTISLRCAICLEFLSQPKVLPCGHSFCNQCIQDLIDHNAPKNYGLHPLQQRIFCPACRQKCYINKFYRFSPSNHAITCAIDGWIQHRQQEKQNKNKVTTQTFGTQTQYLTNDAITQTSVQAKMQRTCGTSMEPREYREISTSTSTVSFCGSKELKDVGVGTSQPNMVSFGVGTKMIRQRSMGSMTSPIKSKSIAIGTPKIGKSEIETQTTRKDVTLMRSGVFLKTKNICIPFADITPNILKAGNDNSLEFLNQGDREVLTNSLMYPSDDEIQGAYEDEQIATDLKTIIDGASAVHAVYDGVFKPLMQTSEVQTSDPDESASEGSWVKRTIAWFFIVSSVLLFECCALPVRAFPGDSRNITYYCAGLIFALTAPTILEFLWECVKRRQWFKQIFGGFDTY